MKYMGSKARIAKYILPIILENRKEGQYYVEPFCGGCNMIDRVGGMRLAADNNKYLIALFEGLQEGRKHTKEIPRELYNRARSEYNAGTEIEFSLFEIAWIGYMASANGRFYEGGYSGTSKTKIGTERNYIEESIKGIEKQIPLLSGTHFQCSDYTDLEIPLGSIVYCDIPYKGTKQYATSKNFNHSKFWNWAREKSKQNTLFVSEYSAPDDFECIWEMEVKSSLSANAGFGGNKNSIEKLFMLK